MSTPERYQFNAMLGAYEDYPPNTPGWAERVSTRLQMEVDSADRLGVQKILDELEVVIPGKIWTLFPDPPCNDPMFYFKLVTGHSWKAMQKLILEFKPEAEQLVREMDQAIRDSGANNTSPGNKTGNNQYQSGIGCNTPNCSEPRDNHHKSGYQRRLQKHANTGDLKAQDLLDRIDAGEISTNKAAVEYGFRSPPVTCTKSPANTAKKIREHFDKDYIERLITNLLQEINQTNGSKNHLALPDTSN